MFSKSNSLILLTLLLAIAPGSAAVEVKNDGYAPGQAAAFQSGFVAGEAVGASLTTGCGTARLQFARFLFGGASGQRTVTLQVFDDSAATATPGASLHSADYVIDASDASLAQVDLRASSINVPARFRIAIEFQHAGLPSIARDTDGSQAANANWVRSDFGGGAQWFPASAAGITTDLIVRAEVNCAVGIFGDGFERAPVELRNDGHAPGQNAAFQGAFVAGDAVGSSLTTGCGATRLEFARFLFGGASGQRTVTLQVFDDTAGTATPGTALHSADYQITADDTNLAQVDLRASSIDVPARFRIAILFQHAGLPSVARDTDGTQVPNANWIRDGGSQWSAAGAAGIPTDWIIRAQVPCSGSG